MRCLCSSDSSSNPYAVVPQECTDSQYFGLRISHPRESGNLASRLVAALFGGLAEDRRATKEHTCNANQAAVRKRLPGAKPHQNGSNRRHRDADEVGSLDVSVRVAVFRLLPVDRDPGTLVIGLLSPRLGDSKDDRGRALVR